jgi:hypothetical protein
VIPAPFRYLLPIAVLLMLPLIAGAKTSDPLIPKQKGAARTVGLFNFLCLKQLPDLEGIERAAGFGEFDQLTGDDLAPYIPEAPTERLLAWRYHDHGEEYVLTAVRAKPDEGFKKEQPAFANATNTSCSLLVPSEQPDQLLGELTRVMGRTPDKTWQEGDTRAYAWTHQQSKALSNVYFYRPEKPGATAALSASIYLKN